MFQQIHVENGYKFHQLDRRPKLCNGLTSDHQLLGPYVVLSLNDSTFEVQSKVLKGAGTVETILAKMIDKSFLMPLNEEKPDYLSFYTTNFRLEDNEIDILEKSAKVNKRETSENKEFYLTIDAINFQLTFWIGFKNMQEAQKHRKTLKL